ncbi:MAG: hypothetical protein KTR24_09580, partial [Saprospiraceae bacterium]|nr:hypothetical protein [Saprospiraceae bacterium]
EGTASPADSVCRGALVKIITLSIHSTSGIGRMKKNRPLYLLLVVYAMVAALTMFFFDGTGDSGDSIMHYLFARYAPAHPALFFDHWAKPIYVLFGSPFAQFGLNGIKVFNVLASLTTIFLTVRICQRCKMQHALLAGLFVIFSPLHFILTFSGLTEPLFAMVLCLGIYLITAERVMWACVVISFLPFVRSEGLLVLGPFLVYLLVRGQWKYAPVLLSGHVIYSLLGFGVHGDLMWVFRKIPYAQTTSDYGSGALFHFAEQLIYVVGVPLYILFWIGVLAMVWQWVRKQLSLESGLLVLLGFFVVFIGHSLFWYLGIFNSLGLIRVFVGVVPLMAIIALFGFNALAEMLFRKNTKRKRILHGLLLAYILLFPFTSNPAAIDWEKDMRLSTSQQLAHQIKDIVHQDLERQARFLYADPYLSEVLNLDPFDEDLKIELSPQALKTLHPGDVVIWENWFALHERHVSIPLLDGVIDLQVIDELKADDRGRMVHYKIYRHPQ